MIFQLMITNYSYFISNFILLLRTHDGQYASSAVTNLFNLPSNLAFFIGTFIFSIGLIGIFFHNRNFIVLLIKIEVMFLGLNFLFICFSYYLLNLTGLVYSLILLALVAAESVIGLSLFLYIYLTNKTLVLWDVTESKTF